eukprot:CAMPEP_0172808940 /NCGR_PEP_ID=MMETSP1075-20121228/7968_1 /TAXON_ID=2916 /ORGANISM="Ceratium fusus, Strain PA161109" /LENGTH=327 /DNA_ID=CAMNT_0013648133 /DNA_START=51 /DNA_END=1031 /DNA_ORIENTATION=+
MTSAAATTIGRSSASTASAVVEEIAAYGALWFRPASGCFIGCNIDEAADPHEMEVLGSQSCSEDLPNNEPLASELELARRKFFGNWLDGLSTPLLWLYPLFFITAQILFFATTGDGVFGNATGGVVESMRLVTTGRAMRWHMFSASAMWVLGAGQFLLKPFRRGRLAWVHRTTGLAFLLLWFLVAGPTAAYLSLFTGNGPRQAQTMMAIFSAVSLETTVWAYYCFWRAWQVARIRANGAASISLHNKLMACGIFFTMTILYQRPLQLIVIGLRRLLLLLVASLDETLTWTRWAIEKLALTVLDHNVGLSTTTFFFGWFQLYLLDGPR